MARRERIDRLLVERGLCESRTRAQALVMAGDVVVGEMRVDKPGALVDPELPIRLKGDSLPYVSRGGLKLEGALLAFGIDPSGKRCVDLGASTGGFTNLLLQRGAVSVMAVDVGRAQLHEKLRQDSRVTSREQVNARSVTLEDLGGVPFDLCTIDVSFISLTLVLPAAKLLMRPGGDLILLVKPQFEAGRGQVGKGGVVRDPEVRRAAVDKVAETCKALGLEVLGEVDSPIEGPAGNREILLHARRTAA